MRIQLYYACRIFYSHSSSVSNRCGFAKSQKAYDKAIDELTSSFDRLEEILSTRRFIAGDRFTLSDIRLFVTLLRFDEVYVVYFKCNTRSVANSPTLLNYCREIYQMAGVASTVNMPQIKEHYYCSHPDLNKWSIIPRGPDFIKMLQEPHNRDELRRAEPDLKRRCSVI
jgi:glutathionyl-hydroquinone reductase